MSCYEKKLSRPQISRKQRMSDGINLLTVRQRSTESPKCLELNDPKSLEKEQLKHVTSIHRKLPKVPTILLFKAASSEGEFIFRSHQYYICIVF